MCNLSSHVNETWREPDTDYTTFFTYIMLFAFLASENVRSRLIIARVELSLLTNICMVLRLRVVVTLNLFFPGWVKKLRYSAKFSQMILPPCLKPVLCTVTCETDESELRCDSVKMTGLVCRYSKQCKPETRSIKLSHLGTPRSVTQQPRLIVSAAGWFNKCLFFSESATYVESLCLQIASSYDSSHCGGFQ